jgi:hypothetical protein
MYILLIRDWDSSNIYTKESLEEIQDMLDDSAFVRRHSLTDPDLENVISEDTSDSRFSIMLVKGDFVPINLDTLSIED